MTDLFNPADHTVEEVNDYLATLDPEGYERERVLQAETEGKNRKGITEAAKPAVPKDGSDGYTRVVIDAYPVPQE